MPAIPTSPVRLQKLLARLKNENTKNMQDVRNMRTPRSSISPKKRAEVLEKTGGRCHICGQRFAAKRPWVADHVHAYAGGGKHSTKNFLPAHAECNRQRWHYSSERLQWIMQLGSWAQSEIARGTVDGKTLAEMYVKGKGGRQRRTR